MPSPSLNNILDSSDSSESLAVIIFKAKEMNRIFTRPSSWLLHHANREGKNDNFYVIKDRILKAYGKHIGYDVQFIEGKKCHTCGGTGIYRGYSWRYDEDFQDLCYRCYNGWYKRPVWNILSRIQYGKHIFHSPYKRAYSKPEINSQIIDGYIQHNRSKYGTFALAVLFFLFEKGYIKRWYKETGIGWRVMWWLPRNWLRNIVHLIKHGKDSYPFRKKRKVAKYHPSSNDDDLPF
jgi:hypothetical protein